MIQNSYFTFKTNVSLDFYETKEDAKACLTSYGAKAIGKEKMAFREMTITVKDFLYVATHGYAFCNLFTFNTSRRYPFKNSYGQTTWLYPLYRRGKNKGGMKLSFKSDQFFAGAQTVFVDIDNTRFSDVSDYIEKLTYKPTCCYMSFSDKREKGSIISRRFRLVYVFDKVLDKAEFRHVSRAINDSIVFDTAEPMDDDCGTRMSQYMNGVFGNNETYQTDIIYSVSDFPQEDVATVQENTTDSNDAIEFSPQLVYDMINQDYQTFMHYHSLQYKYRYRTEKDEWIDSIYQLTDPGYLQIWFYSEIQVDGQLRRRKLGKNACVRRLMYPDMDPDTQLFNLYVDARHFFDNSDGALTLEMLQRKVCFACSKTPEQLVAYCNFEIEYWQKHRPKFILHPGVPHDIGTINEIGRRIRMREFQNSYDVSKSLKQNLSLTGLSQATLYRYCGESGINTNPQKGPTKQEKRAAKRHEKDDKVRIFKDHYDANRTLSDNKSELRKYGVDISLKTIERWSQKYCITSTSQPVYATNTLTGNVNVGGHGFTKPVATDNPESHSIESYSNWNLPGVSQNLYGGYIGDI